MNHSATELGTKSGEILDNAHRERVDIKKHGRGFVSMVSTQRLDELESMEEMLKLQQSVKAGFDQIENGQYSTRSMDELFEEAMKRVEAKKMAG